MDMPIYERLTITGDISIRPVPAKEKVPGSSFRYLIMGPTGAGKSTFIEALAAESQSLGISKDQLAGYTQSVTAFELVNVTWHGGQIYLIDTPGFSDTKISEMEIMDMARAWLLDNGLTYFDSILFLTPITEPRLAGSKRRTIEMLKMLLQPSGDLRSITFVTTMWDQLHNERTRQRAESNFSQLRDTILKEFIDEGVLIEKFNNTRDSAFHILDQGTYRYIALKETPESQEALYKDLHGRIEEGLQQKKALESDLADTEAQTNPALKSILDQSHRENEETLAKFIGQLSNFGDIPEGFEDAHQRLQKAIQAIQNPDCPQDVVSSFAHDDTHINIESSTTSPEATHVDAAPLYVVPAADPQSRSPPEDVAPSSSIQPVPVHSPTSPIPIHPTRMLILKGLLRRLVRAAKQRGKKWFRKETN